MSIALHADPSRPALPRSVAKGARAVLAILVLALYVNSDTVRALYRRPEELWALCVIMIYWVGRVQILAHPTGRKINRRRPIRADMARVLGRAAELGPAHPRAAGVRVRVRRRDGVRHRPQARARDGLLGAEKLR